jgi:hypothetical protein
MSTSVRSQAVAAALAALSGEGSPAAGGIWRTRTEQFTQDEVNSYNVWPVDEKFTEDDDHETLEVAFTLRVQCLVAACNEVDLAVEPLAVFAHQALMADETLGGVVRGIKPASSKWTIAEGGQNDILSFDIDFDVQYQVSRADPTVNTFY